MHANGDYDEPNGIHLPRGRMAIVLRFGGSRRGILGDNRCRLGYKGLGCYSQARNTSYSNTRHVDVTDRRDVRYWPIVHYSPPSTLTQGQFILEGTLAIDVNKLVSRKRSVCCSDTILRLTRGHRMNTYVHAFYLTRKDLSLWVHEVRGLICRR